MTFNMSVQSPKSTHQSLFFNKEIKEIDKTSRFLERNGMDFFACLVRILK